MHIQRAETRDFLEIAKLDREAWAQNRNSEYIPEEKGFLHFLQATVALYYKIKE